MSTANCKMRVLLPLLCCLAAVRPARASGGDRDPAYRACAAQCARTTCGGAAPGGNIPATIVAESPVAVPAAGHGEAALLRALGWSCAEDCRYECMHAVTRARVAHGARVLQYHGKWPFVRVAGLQELGSVTFSVLNAVPHLDYLFRRRALYAPRLRARPVLRPVLLGYSCVALNTWLWSAVFHARDTWWTERLDYHCATALLCYSLFLCCVRVGGGRRAREARVWGPLLAVCAFLARHVWYLNAVKFDYGYNMAVSAGLLATQGVIWAVFGFAHRANAGRGPARRRYMWKNWATHALLFGAAALEILDFPPVAGYIDAHALWHAATVPLGYLWYSFLADDAAFLARAEREKGT